MRRNRDQQEIAHEFSMTDRSYLFVWVADLVFSTLGVSHQWWFVSTYILAQSRADGRYSGSKSAFEWSSWSLVAEFRAPSYEHTMPSGLKNLFAQSLPTRDVLECSEDSPLLVCLDFLPKGTRILVERVQTQIASALIVEGILNQEDEAVQST